MSPHHGAPHPAVILSTVTLCLSAKDLHLIWKSLEVVFQHIHKCLCTFFWGKGSQPSSDLQRDLDTNPHPLIIRTTAFMCSCISKYSTNISESYFSSTYCDMCGRIVISHLRRIVSITTILQVKITPVLSGRNMEN